MIIRFTLKYALYSQIIERYFDDGGPFVLTNYNSKAEYEQFLKDVKQLNNYKFCSIEKEDFKHKLQETIKQTFINYINNITESSSWKTEAFSAEKLQIHKENIFNNIDIKVVNLITDRSKNHQVVFYIDWINNYITL